MAAREYPLARSREALTRVPGSASLVTRPNPRPTMISRRQTILSLLIAPTVIACGKSGPKGPETIAVIPKGTTHEFWKSVHAGAVKASRELGVNVIWKGPLKEDDLKAQIDVVQS